MALFAQVAIDSVDTLAKAYEQAIGTAAAMWAAGHANDQPNQTQLALLDWLARNELLPAGGLKPESQSAIALAKQIQNFREIEAALPEPTFVPAMVEGTGLDESLFIRGNPKTLGEPVPRRFLEAVDGAAQTRFEMDSGRAELARRMVDRSNPLLARVMVNRVWHHLFGHGIVRTTDDFGALGQPPTHPELLDWLAEWYRTDAGYSTKKLIRLLVTSNTYQMSSKPEDALAEEKDPADLLWHRMPVRRLEGEAIRDAILAASGRLDTTMFGPPVPIHLTPFMDGRGRPGNSGPLDGAGRRSIYLEARRNFPAPMMRTFDTPVPFTTVGRRVLSNVPAQSLILMNDPFVVGQAELWAKRLLANETESAEQRITQMFEGAFSRTPTSDEMNEALGFLKAESQTYGKSGPAAVRDEKSWADLCHVMFNVKEFVFVN